jgi:hypothetical protein
MRTAPLPGSGRSGVGREVPVRALGLAIIPRSHVPTFRFSAPVAPVQDLFEWLRIQNVRDGENPDFTRAGMGGGHDS